MCESCRRTQHIVCFPSHITPPLHCVWGWVDYSLDGTPFGRDRKIYRRAEINEMTIAGLRPLALFHRASIPLPDQYGDTKKIEIK